MFFFFAFHYFQPHMSTREVLLSKTRLFIFLIVITHQHFYIPVNAASLLKAEKNPLKN